MRLSSSGLVDSGDSFTGTVSPSIHKRFSAHLSMTAHAHAHAHAHV